MNQESLPTEKEFGKDLKTFEQLPARTKELELLQHLAEKAIGQERVALDAAIRDKAKKAVTNLPLTDKANSTPAGKS